LSVIVAERAILETLHAAVDHQLSRYRFEQRRTMDEYLQRVVDQLVVDLRELRHLISRLPPTPKGELNKRVALALDQPTFDSEVFINVVEVIEESLRQASPRRLADDALLTIRPEIIGDRTPPMILLWEALPPATRTEVECRMQQGSRPTSLVAWLATLADLLDQERPMRKPGAPHSTLQPFVRRVHALWLRLGLRPGLTYDFWLHPATRDSPRRAGRTASGFQSYCGAAIAAFGDFSAISARQVVNAKIGAPGTKRPAGPG
jgi:hypothetical protein